MNVDHAKRVARELHVYADYTVTRACEEGEADVESQARGVRSHVEELLAALDGLEESFEL